MKTSLPFIKFYPSDWLSEESLRLVSFAARGLWIDLLCLMAKSDRRGYLTVNGGVNPTLAQLGKLVGSSESEITPLLDELKQAGTCSVDENTGLLFSRRLVRDTMLYSQAVSFGSKGGNPNLKTSSRNRVKAPVKTTVKLNEQPSLDSNTLGSGLLTSGIKYTEAESIYALYPRKDAKKYALKAIQSALSIKSFGELQTAVTAYSGAVALWPAHDRKFIPMAATWFNRGSYDDDPETWDRTHSSAARPVPWQVDSQAIDHSKGFFT